VPGPWDCFLTLRGLKTLAMRMEEHQKNALALARYLEAHPKIEKVLHTGLESHPQHALHCRQARGHGGTFSFYVRGGQAEAYQLLRGLTLFPQAVSLGGAESLIEYPWTMTHAAVPEEARRKMGIAENLDPRVGGP
jgi:cystathionine gamma-lyase